MKKLLIKFMRQSVEDVVDFFETLQERLQEHVDNETAQSVRLNEEAEQLMATAITNTEKAAKAQKLIKGLPSVK